MIGRIVPALFVSLLLSGCALGGDVTPPAQLATAQSAQASQASASTPTQAAREGTPDAAARRGTVSGTVTLASGPDDAIEGLEIVLHALDEDRESIAQTMGLPGDGRYSFGQVEIVPGRLYFVTAGWDGVIYASSAGHLTADQPSLDLPLVLHEVTADDSGVRITRLHVLMDFSVAARVQVIELWLLSNVGAETVAPVDGKGGIEVILPEGAANLRFQDSESPDRLRLTEQGFLDSSPLLPGESTGQLVFSYDLPYDGDLDFRRTLRYPLQGAVLLLPESGVQVEAEGMQDLGVRQVAGEALHQYALGVPDAGGDLTLRLRGMPERGDRMSSRTGIAVGAVFLAVALIVAGLAWARWSSGGAAGGGVAAGRDEFDAALRAIAALDDDYAAGHVEEAAYRARREAMKAGVRSRMRGRRD